MDRIKEDLMKIEDVYSIEDLNVWSLTAGKTTAIVHLQLGKLLYDSFRFSPARGEADDKTQTTFSLIFIFLRTHIQEIAFWEKKNLLFMILYSEIQKLNPRGQGLNERQRKKIHLC